MLYTLACQASLYVMKRHLVICMFIVRSFCILVHRVATSIVERLDIVMGRPQVNRGNVLVNRHAAALQAKGYEIATLNAEVAQQTQEIIDQLAELALYKKQLVLQRANDLRSNKRKERYKQRLQIIDLSNVVGKGRVKAIRCANEQLTNLPEFNSGQKWTEREASMIVLFVTILVFCFHQWTYWQISIPAMTTGKQTNQTFIMLWM